MRADFTLVFAVEDVGWEEGGGHEEGVSGDGFGGEDAAACEGCFFDFVEV